MTSLRNPGLSGYEARVYYALLRTGATTVRKLSRVDDVPIGRAYDMLNSLEQYYLSRSQVASWPRKYVAAELDTTFGCLLELKR